MRKSEFKKGVYPVMLTPFTEEGKVDFDSLERLVDWYIKSGVAGLFSVCQSSEMFFLTLEERVEIARFVKEKAGDRAAVLASGHVSDTLEAQVEELNAIAETGVDALILLTNRLAAEQESDEIWLSNLEKLMERLPEDIPLGFYECPYPYKRLLSPEILKRCMEIKRFYFIKDTCCNLELLDKKIGQLGNGQLKLFNANTSTLLESLQMGAAGFSGVMANFHPDLYVWLCENYEKEPEKARTIADFLTVASMYERQVYPVNAKYYQRKLGNFESIYTRTKDAALLDATAALETDQLERLTDFVRGMIK